MRAVVAELVLVLLACGCAPAPTVVYVLPKTGGPPAPEVREIQTPPAEEGAEPSRPAVDQRTPRQTLRSFIWAYDARRYDLLMQFIPERDRNRDGEELTEERLRTAWEGPQKAEVESRIEALRRVVDHAPIEEQLSRAAMAYGAGTVELVKESGVWRIRDF